MRGGQKAREMAREKAKATKRGRGLAGVRHLFGADAEAQKLQLLERLEARPPATARALLRAHDDLLFLTAFPGDPRTRRAAMKLLRTAPDWVRRLPRAERSLLNDSGVSGSASCYAFAFPVAGWMAGGGAGEAEIDWRFYDDHAMLDRALFAILRPAELEAAESGEVETRALIEAARPPSFTTSLRWLLDALVAARGPHEADSLYTDAEVQVAWRPSDRHSTTGNRLARAPLVWRRAMRRPPPNIAARICEPATVELLPRPRARQVIEAARAALSARCREVVAISYANPEDVSWCDLGEGAALAVIGIAPSHRLTLETNTGYLLFSNGVPIGYGGVTPLYRQANTGINIFGSFRGSEAAALWVEMLRAFRTLYGVRRFIVNGYQVGEGNAEAIRSGAYWFYHRLGFRSPDPALRQRAAREAERLSKPGAVASDSATLRALARGDLILTLPDADPADAISESVIVKASLSAMRVLAKEPSANRARAERTVAERVIAALGADKLRDFSPDEQRSVFRLAPIVAAIGDVSLWPVDDKKNLIAMLRAKGATQERDFARAAAQCARFFRALESLPHDPLATAREVRGAASNV
jgi:hypothetical protein